MIQAGSSFLSSVQRSLGFAFSFLIYYGLPFHHRVMMRIYAPFIRPGDLCFDIGAHLGDRVYAWSKLGARVVALEPHPGLIRRLRRWYGSQKNITLVEQAVSNQPGTASLWISRLTPSISTISHQWRTSVQRNRRFSTARWEEEITVHVTTLDALIAQYGKPAFCKIDVEGAELDVLQGLSHPLPALSFEYIPAVIETAVGCIERLSQLGEYEYNWRVSEFPRWRSSVWLNPMDMVAQLESMSREDNSGDVYARLVRT
jgi:FkbM family methyltransferase